MLGFAIGKRWCIEGGWISPWIGALVKMRIAGSLLPLTWYIQLSPGSTIPCHSIRAGKEKVVARELIAEGQGGIREEGRVENALAGAVIDVAIID